MLIPTTPFDDQKPGTSGLRKQFGQFQKKNYLENFVQAIFNCIKIDENPTLVLGGDGRLGNEKACEVILKMAKANGFKKVIVGQNGLLSTPAASHLVRKYKSVGAVILSASHNPAGENGDFGVKFNDETGGPASDELTKKIFEESKKITEYHICQEDVPNISQCISQCGIYDFIEVINPVSDYCELMKEIFDFDAIQELFDSGFTMRFDAMNAVTGPYAQALFVEEFGIDEKWILNGTPDVRFGGRHPDPNPTHAKELFDMAMGDAAPDLCVACDGDGDRNMIVGKKQFVSPGDSLAVLCANATLIPFFKKGIMGVARSFPTSRAVDRVAKELGVEVYEVPTGWKWFAGLLEEGKISICGEESFGTGSNHIREKDGIWAVMMWLNVIAKKKMGVAEIMKEHWERFGRDAYRRCDYDGLKHEDAQMILDEMVKKGGQVSEYKGVNQGVVMENDDGGRVVMRLSGTGTQKATLRVYMEQGTSAIAEDASAELVAMYKDILQKCIGRTEPDMMI